MGRAHTRSTSRSSGVSFASATCASMARGDGTGLCVFSHSERAIYLARAAEAASTRPGSRLLNGVEAFFAALHRLDEQGVLVAAELDPFAAGEEDARRQAESLLSLRWEEL